MSSVISTKLMLVPNVNVYEHFGSALANFEFWEVLDTMGLDYASPYYEAGTKDSYVAVETSLSEGLNGLSVI